MTRDEQFLRTWAGERDMYLAWGRRISSTIRDALTPIVAPVDLDYFLKVSPTPRVKADLKLVEKAFYRGKRYADPYRDITDKVGTRFVVLLGRDIKAVAAVIEAIPGWTLSRDRDYEEEQAANPIAFDYAAVHYVVRPTHDVDVAGTLVPADTPCEVQIKTILQHAYSELTHDTIYKPQIQATPAMRRNAAKAMALLEATNDYFEQVDDQVAQALAAVTKITRDLSDVYREATGLEPSPSLLEGLLLEAYEPTVGPGTPSDVRTMFEERPFLIERIKQRLHERNPLFAQPAILLAYLDIRDRGQRALKRWPLTPDEMEPLLNDFGESIH